MRLVYVDYQWYCLWYCLLRQNSLDGYQRRNRVCEDQIARYPARPKRSTAQAARDPGEECAWSPFSLRISHLNRAELSGTSNHRTFAWEPERNGSAMVFRQPFEDCLKEECSAIEPSIVLDGKNADPVKN